MTSDLFHGISDHKKVAFDFDDTLINHPASSDFWDFIKSNPYKQQFYIITMRTHGHEYYMFDELKSKGSTLVETDFEKIINCSDELYISYRRQDNPSANHPYLLFKGLQCKNNNIEVLIDDMEGCDLSVSGCIIYDIEYYHPDDFLIKVNL